MAARGLISAWRTGWRLLWRDKRMWLWVWVLHLAGATVLAALFASIWGEVLGPGLAASDFGGPRTANIIIDLFAHHGDALRGLFPGAALFGNPLGFVLLLYAWAGVIMAAGILAGMSRQVPTVPEPAGDPGAVNEDAPSSTGRERRAERAADLSLPFLGRFARDCGTWAGRFTRLMLVQIFAIGIALFVLSVTLEWLIDGFLGPYPDLGAGTWARFFTVAMLALAYLVLTVIGDYAKVRMIREERRSAILAWWAALRWALRRLPRTLGLHILFVLLAVAGSALYWYLSSLGELSATAIVMVFVQQAYLIFRAGLRVQWYAAELSLFDGLPRMHVRRD